MLEEILNSSSETTLPPDVTQWGETVVRKLTTQFPALKSKIERVEFPKIDKVSGSGLGYALVSNKYRVPVIVRRYKMSPLDLYINGRTWLPLNERTVKYICGGSWPFRYIPESERQQLFKTASCRTYPQAFLDANRNTLVKIAALHPQLLEGIAPHGFYDRARDVYAVTVDPKNALPVTIATLEKEAHYSMSEFSERFGPKLLQQAMRRGYVILSDLPAYTRLENAPPAKPSTIPTVDWGHFLVHGAEYRGVRFPIYQPSSNPDGLIADRWVVLTSDGRYYDNYSNTDFFIRHKDESKPDISGHTPTIGGDFFIKHHDLVMGPYTLLSIDRIDGQLSYMARTNDIDGKRVAIKPIPGLKCVQAIDDGDLVLIPEHYQLLGMERIDGKRGGFKPEPPEKTAGTTIVLRFNPDGTFNIDDKGVTGLDQHMLTGSTKTKALMVLSRAGLSPMDAEQVVQQAQATGTANFDYQGQQQKTASFTKDDEALVAEIIELATRGDLLKTALDISQLDPTSVDQALEIHAVTPETIRKISLLSGEFTKTLEKLCQILFLKRMNQNEVKLDESRLVSAINSLDAIISKLNFLAP